MDLIGITGKAGSGKDTLATFILAAHMDESRQGVRFSFADPVKEATSKMFGVPLNDFYDRNTKEEIIPFWGMSPREMAQLVGTDMARNVYDKNIWINRAEYFIGTRPKGIDLVVIPDVRFENEAEWIRERGGLVIHISRPEEGAVTGSDHESENGVERLEGIDLEFVNAATLQELELLARVFYAHNISRKNPAEGQKEAFDNYTKDPQTKEIAS